VAKCNQFARPMMRRRAGFQPDEARRNLGKVSEDLATSQPLAHYYAARLFDRKKPKNVLCQLKTNCCNIAHVWLPLLVIFDDHHFRHFDAVRGPSTPSVGGLFHKAQSRFRGQLPSLKVSNFDQTTAAPCAFFPPTKEVCAPW
jgi:hypothetical protein